MTVNVDTLLVILVIIAFVLPATPALFIDHSSGTRPLPPPDRDSDV